MPSEIYYDPYDYAIDANPHPVWAVTTMRWKRTTRAREAGEPRRR